MASSQSASASVSVSSPALIKPTGANLDIAWQWNSLRDINNKKAVTCDFCGKTTTGGITRAKRHQMGIRGDVNACKKTPAEVRKLLKEAHEKKMSEKESFLGEPNEDDDEEEEVQEIYSIRSGKRPATSASDISLAAASARKAKSVKGPMDLLLFKNPETTMKLGKAKQTSIKDACDKEARARTIQYIERFFCRNGIPFNVARSKSFKLMTKIQTSFRSYLV